MFRTFDRRMHHIRQIPARIFKSIKTRMQVNHIHALFEPGTQNRRIHAIHNRRIEDVPFHIVHIRREANENMRFRLHLERINQCFEIRRNRRIDCRVLRRVIPFGVSLGIVRSQFNNYSVRRKFNRRRKAVTVPVRRLILLADRKARNAKILDRIRRSSAVTQHALQMMRIACIVRPGFNAITISNAIADASHLARRKRRRHHRRDNNRRNRQNTKHSHNHEVNITILKPEFCFKSQATTF